MKVADFEKLISDAGLNLLSKCAPGFVVSIHVQREYGIRAQCCMLVPDPGKTEDEMRAYVAAKKSEMEAAAKTQQGRMAEERPQKPKSTVVQKKKSAEQVAVNYPAH